MKRTLNVVHLAQRLLCKSISIRLTAMGTPEQIWQKQIDYLKKHPKIKHVLKSMHAKEVTQNSFPVLHVLSMVVQKSKNDPGPHCEKLRNLIKEKFYQKAGAAWDCPNTKARARATPLVQPNGEICAYRFEWWNEAGIRETNAVLPASHVINVCAALDVHNKLHGKSTPVHRFELNVADKLHLIQRPRVHARTYVEVCINAARTRCIELGMDKRKLDVIMEQCMLEKRRRLICGIEALLNNQRVYDPKFVPLIFSDAHTYPPAFLENYISLAIAAPTYQQVTDCASKAVNATFIKKAIPKFGFIGEVHEVLPVLNAFLSKMEKPEYFQIKGLRRKKEDHQLKKMK